MIKVVLIFDLTKIYRFSGKILFMQMIIKSKLLVTRITSSASSLVTATLLPHSADLEIDISIDARR